MRRGLFGVLPLDDCDQETRAKIDAAALGLNQPAPEEPTTDNATPAARVGIETRTSGATGG
jgi:hypothetical protein